MLLFIIPMNIKTRQQKRETSIWALKLINKNEKPEEIVQQARKQLSTFASAFVVRCDAIISHLMASVTIWVSPAFPLYFDCPNIQNISTIFFTHDIHHNLYDAGDFKNAKKGGTLRVDHHYNSIMVWSFVWFSLTLWLLSDIIKCANI